MKWPSVLSVGYAVLGFGLVVALGIYTGLATRGKALGKVPGRDLAHARPGEVAAFLRAHGGPVTAGVALLPVAGGVRITTFATGPTATLTLAGTALGVQLAGFPRPLPALGATARSYRGSTGRPAVVTLSPYGRPLTVPDPAGPRVLTITVGTHPPVDVPIDATTCADPANPRPGELVLALRSRLDPAQVTVTPESGLRFLLIRSRTNASFTLTGSAAARLRLPSAAQRYVALGLAPNALFAFDLRPDAAGPLPVVFDDATTPHFAITFAPGAGIADLATVTLEELQRLIAARLSAVPGTPAVNGLTISPTGNGVLSFTGAAATATTSTIRRVTCTSGNLAGQGSTSATPIASS